MVTVESNRFSDGVVQQLAVETDFVLDHGHEAVALGLVLDEVLQEARFSGAQKPCEDDERRTIVVARDFLVDAFGILELVGAPSEFSP